MSEEEPLYRWVSPDDYYHIETNVSSFGGPSDMKDNPNPDYYYGGSSVTPEGTEDPEDVVALPHAFYDSHVIRPGQRITIMNPANGAIAHPVAKEVGPHAANRGVDLLTHTFKRMGFDTDQKAIIDLRPWVEKEEPTPESEGLQYATSQPDQGEQVRQAISEQPARAALAGDIPTGASIEAASPDGTGETVGVDTQTDTTPVEPAEPVDQLNIPPPNANVHVVKVKPDGTKVFNDGSMRTPDGTDVWTVGGTEYQFNAKFMDKPRAAKVAAGQTAKVSPGIMSKILEFGAPVNKPDGTPFANDQEAAQTLQDYMKTNKIPTKAQTHIADRVTNKMASSRNPYTKNYLTMVGNYESAIDNIDKQDRNGIDDVFLLSAVAGIENPSRSNTENDFKIALKSAGYRGNIEVAAKRALALFNGDTSDQGRILSDDMVKQLKPATTNAVRKRWDLYKAGVEPFRKQIEQAGLDPDTYIPDLKFAGDEAIVSKPEGGAAPAVARTPDPGMQLGATLYDKRNDRHLKYIGGPQRDPNSWVEDPTFQ